MIKRFLVICVFFLLVVSTLGSLSFEEDSKITEQNKLLDDLAFYCTAPNGFNEEKFEYYKIQLLKQNTDEVINQIKTLNSDELITIQNAQSIITSFNGPMNSAWPVKCHDIHHTGRSPYSTADNPGIEKWRFYMDGWMEDTPVIGNDGTIYFGGSYGGLSWYLIAIYPNGTLKWRYKTDGLILWSSPAIAEDGTVYVGSWDSHLYAINSNGTLKWRFPSNNANIASSPVIGEDGTVYFGDLGDFGYNSRLYSVNPNGTENWHYTINDRIYSDPAIGDDGTIYFGSNDKCLYAINPNGTLKWKFMTGAEFGCSASIADDGTIYAAGCWGNLYALYPNGTVKWKCGISVNSNPSIDIDGTIYIGGENLYAVYPNGTLKWSFDLGDERWVAGSSPAISADGTIYIGYNIGIPNSWAGEIIAINSNGTERWRKRIANYWVHSSPSIAEDGTVYIGCAYNIAKGYLHAFGNIELNNPPYTPSISGPTNVNVGDENWFTFIAIDPDNNPIQLFVDWGDGTSGWVGEYASGEQIWFEHAWNNEGTYIVKAKVKDVLGEESDFGYLEVNVVIPPVYKKAFIFGIITNLTIEDTIMFEAVHIKVVRFLPFSINLFKSGEKFTLTNNYRGFIRNRLIFSLCTMIV